MNRRLPTGQRTVVVATIVTILICGIVAVSTVFVAQSRTGTVPERAIDMWGVEHDLTGLEWTLFDFVHPTGCGYCVLNAAAYQKNFADALADAGVHTFGVDVYEDQRDLIDYVKHHRIRFPILTEPDWLWSYLRCPGLPGQSMFYDGKLVFSETATLTFRNYDRIRNALAGAGLSDRVPPYQLSGPMKKALNCVFEDESAVVIVGDGFEADARTFFPGLTKVTFQMKRASEVTDADLTAGSICVIGSPEENAFLARLRGKTPFHVEGDVVALADTVIHGTDLMLSYCCPNPWNRERYLVVNTGTFAVSTEWFPHDTSQDFVIARRSASADKPAAIIARGICAKRDNQWALAACHVLWEGGHSGEPAETVEACGKQGCPMPLPLGASDTQPESAGSRDTGGDSAEPGLASFGFELEPAGSWPGRFPSLSAADDGACWVAWDRPQDGIYVTLSGVEDAQPRQLWAAGDPGLPVPGVTEAVDAFKPTVVADGRRQCWLAWSELEAGTYQVFAARVRADGTPVTWRMSDRSNLDHHSPAVVLAGDGNVALVWYTWEANARRPYYRTWNCNSWSAVDRVPTQEGSQFAWYFSGVAARDGNSRYVWMQHYPSPTSIVSAALSGEGWGEPELIADTGRYPSIAFDPATHQTRVVWQQWMREQSNQLQYQWRIFTSVSQEGGKWSAPEQLPGCPAGRNTTPVIAVDGIGKSWVFWSHKGPGDQRPADQTWRILCVVADAAGWHGPYTVSDPSTDARSPIVTATGGSTWVAWHEGRGDELRVVVRKIRPQAAGTEVAPEEWSISEQTNN